MNMSIVANFFFTRNRLRWILNMWYRVEIIKCSCIKSAIIATWSKFLIFLFYKVKWRQPIALRWLNVTYLHPDLKFIFRILKTMFIRFWYLYLACVFQLVNFDIRNFINLPFQILAFQSTVWNSLGSLK